MTSPISAEQFRALPIYQEGLASVIETVPSLKFTPWWHGRETFEGLRFCLEGTEPARIPNGAVWAYPGSKLYPVSGMYTGILAFAGMYGWEKKIFRHCLDEKLISEEGREKLEASCDLHEALLADCMERTCVKLVAQGLLKQAQAALDDGTVRAHNRSVSIHKLGPGIIEAIRGGLMAEDIFKIAKALEESAEPKENLSLYELFEKATKR